MIGPLIPDWQSSGSIETLTLIWKRVFLRSSLGIDDDFFALGGNAFLAAKLSSALEKELNIEVSPTIVCNAPTIRKLSLALSGPQPQRPIVQLKSGAKSPPIFISHGGGGSVIDLVPLARKMETVQPIYGMEFRGNDGKAEPHDQVEEMAKFFVQAIRAVQPHGPYFLVGYSLGGLITFEMARQLSSAGEKITLLAMVEAYPHRRHIPLWPHLRLSARLVANRAARLIGMEKHSRGSEPINSGMAGEEDRAIVRTAQHVKDAQERAWEKFRPGRYNGPVKFVRAAAVTHFPSDPAPIWSRLVGTFEVETLPGDHVDLVTTQIEPVAIALSRYIKEANGL
jgi:thioesterase domain-containing protein